MNSSKLRKSALASAIAMAIGGGAVPLSAIADITLTFQNNVTPTTPPLPYSAAGVDLQYEVGTEFRVMTPYGTGVNNGQKDAFFGGESWTFNNAGQLIGTASSNPAFSNPGGTDTALTRAGLTTGVSGFPICLAAGSCPVIQESSSFLQADNAFNFLAPVLGTTVGDIFGVATVTVDLSNNNTVLAHFPVAEAQWADGKYIIGGDPNPNPVHGDKCADNGPCGGPGVDIAGPVTVTSSSGDANVTFDFKLWGESSMTLDEVTLGGFNKNTVQWEIPGSGSIDNQNPVAVDDGSAGSPNGALTNTPTSINVLANDFDPDWVLLNSQDFDALSVDGTGACQNGGTLTDNNVNVIYQSALGYAGPDNCTYTIADGRTGVSNSATVYLDVSATGGFAPTANDDGPGSTPGGPYETNQGVAVSVDVLANDVDVDSDPMQVSRVDVTSANGGTVVIINGGVEGGNNVMYTPASGYNGVDSFTYDVTDNIDGTSTANVRVSVIEFAESSAGTVTTSQRVSASDIGVEDPDTLTSCDGGCYDIEVQGVPSGGQIEILLPKLLTGYIANSVFRHFVTSTGEWEAHDAPDTVYTAPVDATTGLCPGLTSSQWQQPTVNDTCVKYSITDEDGSGNGPNDDNPMGTIILDPVGFGQSERVIPSKGNLSQYGCSLNSTSGTTWRDAGVWFLIGGLLAFMRLFKKQKSS